MSLNDAPSASRIHIGFFGRRNAGKSSLVNAVAGQDLALVSGIKGTTTDPVYKAMELLPLGPVVIIDTPGIDDEGELGDLRVRRARKVINKTDAAVLVMGADLSPNGEFLPAEEGLIAIFKEKNIPYIIVQNKCDLPSPPPPGGILQVSAKTGRNIGELKEKIAALASAGAGPERPLVGDLVGPSDLVMLAIPIDKAAPKGRLILPQQQVIRSILDAGAAALAVRENAVRETLAKLAPGGAGAKPALVITDSQAFAQVSGETPADIPLTSFSILFARYKGWLEAAVLGAGALDGLGSGDKILICEGCTHHRQCDDIGTVKLPRLIRGHCGAEPEFRFCCGSDFPDDLSPYKLVVHCGACMLNEREMQYRRLSAEDQNVPFTNYGIAIAHITGILERSIAVFGGK